MCLRCDTEDDEPICSLCMSEIFKDHPLWHYPHSVFGSSLAQSLIQEAALSSDGTIITQRSYMNLKETIEKLALEDKEKESTVSEYLNRLLSEIGVPLALDIHNPIVILEEDKELVETVLKRMENDVLCSSRELCLRMGNILWHYGNGLKELGLKMGSSKAEKFFEGALKYYLKAHSLKTDKVSFRNVSTALYTLKDYETSLEYCEKGQKFEDSQLFLIKGLNLNAIGKTEEAITNLNKALELNRSPPMLVEVGKFLASIGKSEDALTKFDDALRADEDSEDALLSKHELLVKLGREKEAEENLMKLNEKGLSPRLIRAPPQKVFEREIVKEIKYEPEIKPEPAEKPEEKEERLEDAKEEYKSEWVKFKGWMSEEIKAINKLKADLECREKEVAEKESKLKDLATDLIAKREVLSFSKTIEKEPEVKLEILKPKEELPHPLMRIQVQPFEPIEKNLKLYEAFKEMVSRADSYMKNQKYEEALFCYDAASKLSPKSVEIWLNKAKALEFLERYEEALQSYDHILKVDKKDERIWKNKIALLQNLGLFEEALDAYKNFISIFPGNEALYNEKGKLLMELGRYDEAVLCFKSIIDKNPMNIEAYLNLGDVFLHLNRYDEAYQSFNKVAEIEPRNADAWYRRGLIQNKWGRWGAAIQFFNWAIALKEGFAEAWMSKGNVLREHGELKDALYSYEKVVRLEPKNEMAWYSKAKILWEQGKHREAVKCIENLLKLSPKSEVAIEIKAKMIEKLKGKKRELMKNEDYLMKKAKTLLGEGKRKDALKLLAFISKLNPRNEDTLLRMAEILEEEGKLKRALKKYTTVLNLNPMNKEALMRKALLYRKLEAYEEAFLCFELLLKLNPEDEKIKQYKEECLKKMKEGKDESK